MVYGHFESLEDRIHHLEKIRELQDQTGGFEFFTPVKLRSTTQKKNYFPSPSGIEDMRVFALCSLFLDNIDYVNVQAVVGEEGWEQVFDFGGNYVPVFFPGSHRNIPHYGDIYLKDKQK
jgi:aminodeoxyfutalosine synthase